jgi:hypothetical protein
VLVLLVTTSSAPARKTRGAAAPKLAPVRNKVPWFAETAAFVIVSWLVEFDWAAALDARQSVSNTAARETRLPISPQCSQGRASFSWLMAQNAGRTEY